MDVINHRHVDGRGEVEGRSGTKQKFDLLVIYCLFPPAEGKRRGRKVQAPRRGRRISRAGSREGRRRRERKGEEEREIG
jgi:hypothetical protein